ncbi:hypothetical protein [Streptomyces umbrinus]|uniref:hypothetical protein n=1 Tax=Streptomyces umbrinus TaxID=67370 RepID=UPI0027D8C5E8|nr:hypothetical protein [Streptomyces umbrinus]
MSSTTHSASYTYGGTQESLVARLDRTVGNPTAKAAIDMALWEVLGLARYFRNGTT